MHYSLTHKTGFSSDGESFMGTILTILQIFSFDELIFALRHKFCIVMQNLSSCCLLLALMRRASIPCSKNATTLFHPIHFTIIRLVNRILWKEVLQLYRNHTEEEVGISYTSTIFATINVKLAIQYPRCKFYYNILHHMRAECRKVFCFYFIDYIYLLFENRY